MDEHLDGRKARPWMIILQGWRIGADVFHERFKVFDDGAGIKSTFVFEIVENRSNQIVGLNQRTEGKGRLNIAARQRGNNLCHRFDNHLNGSMLCSPATGQDCIKRFRDRLERMPDQNIRANQSADDFGFQRTQQLLV